MELKRTLHILTLIVLIAVGAATKSSAKSENRTLGFEQFINTQWHVIEVNRTAYGTDRSPITLHFTENGIWVDQACLAFLATPNKQGGMLIEYAQDTVLCVYLPPEQQITAHIFENFEGIEQIDKIRIRIFSLDGNIFTAVRQPAINTKRAPVRPAIKAIHVQSPRLAFKLDNLPAFKAVLGKCRPDNTSYKQNDYWFETNWGDGTKSNGKSGPRGEPCAKIIWHHYAQPGYYDVSVKVTTLGSDSEVQLVFASKYQITLEK